MLNHFSNSFIFQSLKQKILLITATDLTSAINKIYPIRIRKRPDFWFKTNWNLKSNDEAFFSWWFFTWFLLYFTIYQSKNRYYRLTRYTDFTLHKNKIHKNSHTYFTNKTTINRNKSYSKHLRIIKCRATLTLARIIKISRFQNIKMTFWNLDN